MRKPKIKPDLKSIYEKGLLENYLKNFVKMDVFHEELKIGYEKYGKHILIYYVNLEDNCLEIIYTTIDSIDNLKLHYLLTLFNKDFYYMWKMPF